MNTVRRSKSVAWIAYLLLFAALTACEGKTVGSCFADDNCRLGWFLGMVAPSLGLFDPPCPPPLTTLQPGLQTINTGGSNISPYFRINQSDTFATYQFKVYEKPGQDIGIDAYNCKVSITEYGLRNTSQTEVYNLTTNSSYYYYFFIQGDTNDFTIQVEVPANAL